MAKPRILIIENSTDVTGALNSILRSSHFLSDLYEFTFILPRKSKATEYVKKQGFHCLELPMKEMRKNFFSLLLYFPFLIFNTIKITRLMRTLRIDLIVNNDFYNLLPATCTFFGGKIPYVCYVRFLPSKFPSLLVRLWSGLHERYALIIIAVSNAVKTELPNQNKVVVVGNELPQTEDAAYAPSESTLLLYPANYIRGKGHDYALESFAVIAKKYPDWKLRFVGSDMNLQKNKDFKTALIKRAEELHISNQIEWLGFSDDIARLYTASSIILNFSESESFSLTCLEAMFYGRAVVATACGGPSEIIDANETGILVPVNDLKAMAKGIEFLISHPKEREIMASRAYQKVRVKFSNQNTIQKLGEVYSRAIQHKLSNF